MSRRETFYVDVSHPGLNTFQRIRGTDPELVERRAAAKVAEWESRWARLQHAEAQRNARQHKHDELVLSKWHAKQARENAKAHADQLTEAAEDAVTEVSGLLATALANQATFSFASLRDSRTFDESEPQAPRLHPFPSAPTLDRTHYVAPPMSRWARTIELLIPPFKTKRLRAEAAAQHSIDESDRLQHEREVVTWQERCAELRAANAAFTAKYNSETAAWRARRQAFLESQSDHNRRVGLLETRYGAGEKEAIEEYCDLVLSASHYPDSFPKTDDLSYNPSSKQLIVDYELPIPDQTPRLKSVRYVQSRGAFEDVLLPESARRKIYDDAVYQIVIRTLFELFSADALGALDAIALNGFVNTVDPGTGQKIRPYIVSVHCTKAEFSLINLATVEPKACFRRLKGTGSAQLSSISPVAPLVQLQREDPRFVPGREVLAEREGTNLAAMPWEDFEHLVRQLFEMEFGGIGSEVKVTRASRDGGIDAVAFDPDPIRGGKFVIQAKRYTHTVSVSAVRDLYGAVMNEGAVKGILVTTASFGADAYDFARDKPITLLDGGNLLFMLQKHGRKAYIDLAAARANV